MPAIALLETGAHLVQVRGKIPEADWIAARARVKTMAAPDDLVAFAPRWVDPIGRQYFTDEIADVAREARADDTRFPRAIVVSVRGAHLEELRGWKETAQEKVGAITLTTLVNPAPAKVLDDLVVHTGPGKMSVTRLDGARESECAWTETSSQSGNIGFGPTIPGERYACSGGGFVGVSVVQSLDYLPHRCFYVPPQGGASVLRIRFADVTFGKTLHGHHAISWAAERYLTGTPVTLVWKSDGRTLGKLTHNDGDSWKPFELDTSDLEGKKTELVAEVSSPSATNRQYCFEADTR